MINRVKMIYYAMCFDSMVYSGFTEYGRLSAAQDSLRRLEEWSAQSVMYIY